MRRFFVALRARVAHHSAIMMRLSPLLFLLSACALAQEVSLSNTRDLAGWELVTTTPGSLAEACTVKADGVIAVAGKPVAYLATTGSHQNYRLQAEWRWTDKPGNGGILVHIASGPKDRAWPLCFQIQLKQDSAGDLLPMAGATFKEALSTPPDAKTPLLARRVPGPDRPAGEWNTAVVTCQGDTIEVIINGVLQNRVTGCSLGAGRVGFQLEGTPFELRHVRLTPLP